MFASNPSKCHRCAARSSRQNYELVPCEVTAVGYEMISPPEELMDNKPSNPTGAIKAAQLMVAFKPTD